MLLVEDPETVDLARSGARIEDQFTGGVNVHLIAPVTATDDVISLRVWERGAGLTEACGSGATVAALAARDWGLVGDEVTVRMPGGDARVSIGADTLVLVGPSTYVADVEVEVAGG